LIGNMSNIWTNLQPSGLVGELVIVVLALFGFSLLFWLLIGRFRLHNALINIYIAFAILQVSNGLSSSLGKFSPLIIFLALVVFLTMVDSKLFEIHLSGSGLSIWQVLVLSFLEAGLLFSIILTILPEKPVLDYVSGESLQYFISPLAGVIWMILPLVFLLFIGRGKN